MRKAKLETKIVKVMRGLSSTGAAIPALVYPRGGRQQRRQFLSPDVERELGHDLFGYFEAQFLQDIWWIGERIPTGARNW